MIDQTHHLNRAAAGAEPADQILHLNPLVGITDQGLCTARSGERNIRTAWPENSSHGLA